MPYLRSFGDDPVTTVADTFGVDVAPTSISDFIGQIVNTMNGLETATPADVATASGGASIAASDFTSAGGICKAANLTALNYVKELQRQLNRVAQVKGFGKVGVDGEVGPGTLALFAKVQTVAGAGQILGSPNSCMGVAPDADVLSAQVQAYANTVGAPATASAAFTGHAATIVRPNGQEVAAASLFDTFDRLPGLEKVAMLGVFGGIGYMLWAGKRKRKGTRR
jgi:hypothetical protein